VLARLPPFLLPHSTVPMLPEDRDGATAAQSGLAVLQSHVDPARSPAAELPEEDGKTIFPWKTAKQFSHFPRPRPHPRSSESQTAFVCPRLSRVCLTPALAGESMARFILQGILVFCLALSHVCQTFPRPVPIAHLPFFQPPEEMLVCWCSRPQPAGLDLTFCSAAHIDWFCQVDGRVAQQRGGPCGTARGMQQRVGGDAGAELTRKAGGVWAASQGGNPGRLAGSAKAERDARDDPARTLRLRGGNSGAYKYNFFSPAIVA